MLTRRQLAWSSLSLLFAGSARAQDGSVTATLRMTEQRVLMDAQLNGRGPYSFILDTGAELSGVRLQLAQELGLRQRKITALNRGRNFPVFAVDELVLGGAIRQRDVALFGLDGAHLGGDGLLAAGMVTALSSELDFDEGRWRVYPQGAPDTSTYNQLDAEVRASAAAGLSSRLHVTIDIDGAQTTPVIDTGAPRPLVIDNATGVKAGLWAPGVPYAPIRTADIAGPSRGVGRLVRSRAVKIGDITYARVPVLVQPPQMILHDTVLGLPLIRTLNWAYDRRSRTLWARRNSVRALASPGYGGSGLWVDAERGAVRVTDVGFGSPAAAAGVRPGDIVEGAGDLSAVTQLLDRPDGATVNLRLKGRDGSRDVTFVLKRYL